MSPTTREIAAPILFIPDQLQLDLACPQGRHGPVGVSPEDPDGTELLLAPLNDAAKALQAHRRATGTPPVSFTVDDCQRYRDVRDRGVASEPEAMGDWGTDAVLEGGGGNALNPDQHVPAGVGG